MYLPAVSISSASGASGFRHDLSSWNHGLTEVETGFWRLCGIVQHSEDVCLDESSQGLHPICKHKCFAASLVSSSLFNHHHRRTFSLQSNLIFFAIAYASHLILSLCSLEMFESVFSTSRPCGVQQDSLPLIHCRESSSCKLNCHACTENVSSAVLHLKNKSSESIEIYQFLAVICA